VASENYFQLFGLPSQYDIDAAALEATWRALAARVHPDRYATAGAAERRVAMQWASTINEAYRVLKSPLDRARYLCEQAGCDLQIESNTRMDGAFLMRQMEWREQLDEARDGGSLGDFDALQADIEASRARMAQDMARLLDQERNYAQAAGKVREWMFIEKFAQEVLDARHALTDRQH